MSYTPATINEGEFFLRRPRSELSAPWLAVRNYFQHDFFDLMQVQHGKPAFDLCSSACLTAVARVK